MKKTLVVLFLMAASLIVEVPLANAYVIEDKSNETTELMNLTTTSAQIYSRYVRVRGRRYFVRYRVFYRRGRRYVRIISYRRA